MSPQETPVQKIFQQTKNSKAYPNVATEIDRCLMKINTLIMLTLITLHMGRLVYTVTLCNLNHCDVTNSDHLGITLNWIIVM